MCRERQKWTLWIEWTLWTPEVLGRIEVFH